MPGSRNPYRILCLDGGGRWSLISVMALQAIFGEHAKGHDILKGFDLVAANSAGSIVLGVSLRTNRWPSFWICFAHPSGCFPENRSLRRLGSHTGFLVVSFTSGRSTTRLPSWSG